MAAKKAQFGTRSNFTQTSDETGPCRAERSVLAQAISVALIASVAPGPLFAQDKGLEEIVVTATKRAESVMDVPLAITAMTGEFIREVNLNDIKIQAKCSLMEFVGGQGLGGYSVAGVSGLVCGLRSARAYFFRFCLLYYL